MKKNLIIRFKNTDNNLKFFLLKAQNALCDIFFTKNGI